MSEFDPKQSAQPDEPETPRGTPGVTGIFGVLAPSPAVAPDAAAGIVPSPWPAAAAPLAAPPPQAQPMPVVVHEVKFQPQDEEGHEAESSLQRLLQSLPPAHAAPQRPATAGDFTQLLSALQAPPAPTPLAASAAPAASSTLAGAATPSGGATAFPPVPTSPAALAMEVPAIEAPAMPPAPGRPAAASESPAPLGDPAPVAEASSFTRLFEALGPPVVAPQAPAAAATPTVPTQPPMVGSREASGPQSSSSNSFAREDPASFTQLFHALGSQPRSEPSQAADYPPLAARKPTFAPPPAARPSSFSAQGWPSAMPSPAVPPSPLRSEPEADLSSLTQLLYALEHPTVPPAAPHGGAPDPIARTPGRDPLRRSSASGATVAFTPPESIQRRGNQPPLPAMGPGDFTRVLQASALRESGLGSQAAAAQGPPVPPVHSAPPVHGAAAPLPPWASPSMPYVPHVSGLAHANGSVPGLGPMPGMHAAVPTPHMHMQPAFMVPEPSTQGTQGAAGKTSSRSTIVPLILMVIIVILVGVLLAVLLRR